MKFTYRSLVPGVWNLINDTGYRRCNVVYRKLYQKCKIDIRQNREKRLAFLEIIKKSMKVLAEVYVIA